MIARMSDTCQGYCAICECGMVGQIITGSSNVLTNNSPTARVNDIVQGACGHTGTIIATSKNMVNSMSIVKMGDQFQGIFSGSVITGSSNVTTV